MSNDAPFVSTELTPFWGKNYWDQQPWPKPFLKGKPLLVNDIFVRVDDIPSYAVYADYGNRRAVSVETTSGSTYLNPSKCQGYVLRPNEFFADIGLVNVPTTRLRFRCMTLEEINEARESHIYTRPFGRDFRMKYDVFGEYKNVPNNDQHGQIDSSLRLRAFNHALHKKRQEIVEKIGQRGLNWNFDKLMNATYDDAKMTEMFRKKIPPPPPGSNTGRE